MLGIPRFAEWLESTNLAATLTPTMEKQTRQEEQQENTVQWREEYHTHWHDHIKSIRIGLWVVIVLFAVGVLIPIPLYLFADAKFTTVMKIGAFAPIPFLFILFGVCSRTLLWRQASERHPRVEEPCTSMSR